MTVRMLDASGVAEGWRCLDVGSGGGSVAKAKERRSIAQPGGSQRFGAVSVGPEAHDLAIA